jgi:WD40 repeat protein
VAAAVQFVLKTPRGTILVEVSQPDATITVEDAAGGKIKLTSPKLAKAISIEIPEGKNILKVDKEGFQGHVEEFTITHEGQKIFQVKLEPLAARPVVPDEPKKLPVKTVDPPVKPVDPPAKPVDPVTKTAGAAPFSKLVKKIPAVRNRPVYGVALSPDHKLVACASAAEQLVLYDFATGDEVARLEGHKGVVSSVHFSSDGRTLYSAGDDHVIRIWDVERREPKGTLDGHTGRISDLMFLPDGQTLASASHDKTVRLWKDGKQVKSFDDSQRLMNLDISSDGKLLATIALEGDLSLWNLETGDLKFRVKAHEMGHGVAISPLGDQVATSSSRAKVATVWDVKSHQAVFQIPHQNDAVSVLAFAPDGLLYVGSNMVRAWNVKQNQTSEMLSNDDPVLVNSIQFTSDKKLLLTGDVRGKVRIYSRE